MAGLDQSAQIRDLSTGYGLFTAPLAAGWEVIGSGLGQQNTSSKPFAPFVELQRPGNGAVMRMEAGPAGTRNGMGMNLMTAMYGAHTIGIDTTSYADMPDPSAVIGSYAARQLDGVAAAANLRFEGQVDLGDLSGDIQRVPAVMKRQLGDEVGLMPTGNPFVAKLLYIYRFDLGQGNPWKMAVFLREYAAKLGGFDAGALGGAFGGIADSLGSAFGGIAGSVGQALGQSFDTAASTVSEQAKGGLKGLLDFGMSGGLIGKAMRERKAAEAAGQAQQPYAVPQQQAAPVQQEPAQQEPAQVPVGFTHDFASYARGGTIVWSVEALASYIGPEQDFAERLNGDFLPLVLNATLHSDILGLTSQYIAREAAAIQNATNVALANKQAQFQAMQAAHRQQQAAFDSYNQAWQARSDAHHASFRASTNAQFSTPASPGSAPDYSEAVRGVNTYTTSDGREVEVSVQADRAWENQAGDVIGTSGGFEPGADWTELPRT